MQYSCRASLGRWIEGLRGRLPGVSCRCPARQSPATGSDDPDVMPSGRRRRPRCRPDARTLRNCFSAALIAVDRCGALAPLLAGCWLLALAPRSGRRARDSPRLERSKTLRKRSHTAREGRDRSHGQDDSRWARSSRGTQRAATSNRELRRVCDGRYFSSPTPHGLICEPVAHQRKPLSPGVTVVRRSTKAAAGHQLKEVSTTASAGLSRRARDRRRLTCREAARRAESKAGQSKEA